MPRQLMGVGEHGKISETEADGLYIAACYVRDSDGRRRRAERSSRKSAEAARYALQAHLRTRRPPASGDGINDKSTLSELFEAWITRKVSDDGLKPQSAAQCRTVWRVHAADQLGALRIRELKTGRADAHLKSIKAQRQAELLWYSLRSMYSLACRFDVVDVNPIAEARPSRAARKSAPRALKNDELGRVIAAIEEYTGATRSGPRRGRHLLPFIAVALATGARPGEVLALQWENVHLDDDPPTVTISGTVIDYGKVPGQSVHVQDARKHDAPPLTVTLPDHGVAALRALAAEFDGEPAGLVFRSRAGGPLSLANLRRSLRDALPDDLRWFTPHSCRRTTGTVIRDALGVEAAQQQLGHVNLTTTEQHYVERRQAGPDARTALDDFLGHTTAAD